MLLAQQQVRMETELRLCSEVEMRVKAEVQASTVAEQRECVERCAREAAQARAIREENEMPAAQWFAGPGTQGHAWLHAQNGLERAAVIARRLLAGLRVNMQQSGRSVKTAGLVLAMAFVGFLLPVLYGHQADALSSAKQPAGAAVQSDLIQADAAWTGLKFEKVETTALFEQLDLKLTDHLGKIN